MEKIVPITENKDFLNIYRKGKSFATESYIFYALKNKKHGKRLGITTGKKCGNSVQRSRCRRLLRVIYRQNADIIPENFDIVFIARKGLHEKNSNELTKVFRSRVSKFFLPGGSDRGGRGDRGDRGDRGGRGVNRAALKKASD